MSGRSCRLRGPLNLRIEAGLGRFAWSPDDRNGGIVTERSRRRVLSVDDAGILNEPWPLDLDPETVPFRVRTVTILRRKAIWDDMTRLDSVTEGDVLGWWTAGIKTVADLRDVGNAAIATHHAGAPERERQAAELARMVDGLARVAGEAWMVQVWWRDPRFRDLLPRSGATVAEIINGGSLAEQQELWVSTDQLEARIERLAALSLEEAVAALRRGHLRPARDTPRGAGGVLRSRAGDLIVGWDDLTRMPWTFSGAYVVYEYQGAHYWIRPGLASVGDPPRVTISDAYAPAGYLVDPPYGLATLYRLTPTAAYDARTEYEQREQGRHHARHQAEQKQRRDRDEWLGAKTRNYAPTRLPHYGTALATVRLSTIRDKLTEYGITVTPTKSGRVLVSAPHVEGANQNSVPSRTWLDLACRFADVLAADPGRCDVPRCGRTADVITDSDAVVCPKHAGITE